MSKDFGEANSAFRFRGNWQEFAQIVIPNLLLTIVTLGIYRFWATTRERQYLWSKSDFIDTPLEWTGRGIELFIGFLMALLLFFLPFFVLQFVAQALALQGYGGWAALLTVSGFVLIYYLIGVARFRALRYRLSRTYWHGIRGGSDDQGFGYGWSYIWKNTLGSLALGLLVPWAMMDLWNERWKKMSFGPHQINAGGDSADTFKRYLLFYLAPILLIVAALAMGALAAISGIASGDEDSAAVGVAIASIAFVLIFYLGLGLIALAYYSKFFRVAVGGMTLYKLEFAFGARTKDWFMLFLGDVGLWLLAAVPIIAIMAVTGLLAAFGQLTTPQSDLPMAQQGVLFAILILSVIPFALVGPFIRYRHWKFFIDHMGAYGEVDLDEMTQSQTEMSKHGEGLLDAFDVGAI